MKQWLWTARDRARTWWFWHGPRGRVHQLEGEIESLRGDTRLLIHALAEVIAS